MTSSNKLTKSEIQKLALSSIGFLVLLYVYFSFFLGPLNNSRATMERSIADLQTKVANSKTELTKANKLEAEAGYATTRYAALQSFSPEGAPIAWFPPRIKSFFANQRIDKATAKPEGNGAGVPYKQPELATWSKYSWQIDLPQADFASAGKAIAELENSEPLLAIVKLTIKGSVEDPQFQQVMLSANTAILKR
ncbi:MAG: hypothetical protein M3Z22_00160 [Verrucomicrobiota bacterium]|nr:hypothetical protein [Verrucomicrobiota bacterium]